MHATEGILPLARRRVGSIELAAGVLLVAVLAITVLYPETFMPDAIIVRAHRVLPLTIMMIPVAAGSAWLLYRHHRSFPLAAVDIAMILFVSYLLLRNIAGGEIGVAVKYLVYAAGIYFLGSFVIRSARLRDALLASIAVITLLTVAYGLLEYAVQENFIYGPYIGVLVPGGLHRIGSTLAHPVVYAAFLIQALPFCVYLWLRRGGWLRWLGAASSFSTAIAVFFTFSKGSWLVGAVVAISCVAYVVSRTHVKLKFVLPGLTVLLLIGAIVAMTSTDIASQFSGDRNYMSFYGRLVAWNGALAGTAEHPLLGVGLRQGQPEIMKHEEGLRNYFNETGVMIAVDNYYLDTLLEEGPLGLILLLAALGLIGREAYLAIRQGRQRWLALACTASAACIVINMLTFDALMIWPNYIFFWLAAGALRGIRLNASA